MKVEILEQKGNYFLWIDDSLWMWDIESEKKIQYDLAHEAYGDVLVAGYGLGLLQEYLCHNPNVNHVTTAELSRDVIQANVDVGKEIFGAYVLTDFYTTTFPDKYDCIIGDIWKEIVPESLKDYKKFKEHALTLIKSDGKIFAWGKDYFEYLIEKGL